MTTDHDEQQRKAEIGAVEEALKKGWPPPSPNLRKKSAVTVASEALGIAKSTLHSRIRRYERESSGPDWSLYAPKKAPAKAIKEKLKDDSEVLRFKAENARLKRELEVIQKDNLAADEVRRRIFGLSEEPQNPPDWMIKVRKSSGAPGVPSVIWSDWHCNEVIEPEQINGVNRFNLTIAEQRIKKLVDATLDLCFNHMTGDKQYPGIVVNCLGDMISGIIHPELKSKQEVANLKAVLWVSDIIIWALDTLKQHFPSVYFVGVPGNHGREGGMKPEFKDYVAQNYDWLIYNIVERHFRAKGEKGIAFAIPESGEWLYRVYGHRYMAVHGDDLGVRGGDGIIGSLGPIARGEIKVRHSSAQIGRDYDTLLMGHWHQILKLKRVIVNGSLCGYNEYAQKRLRAVYEPPAQALWFTHPKRGITCWWEVSLDDKQHNYPQTQEWVSAFRN